MCITVPNLIEIGQTAAEIWQFNSFQNGGRQPSWIFEIQTCKLSEQLRDPHCITIPNFVKIGKTAILDLLGTCWDHPH